MMGRGLRVLQQPMKFRQTGVPQPFSLLQTSLDEQQNRAVLSASNHLRQSVAQQENIAWALGTSSRELDRASLYLLYGAGLG